MKAIEPPPEPKKPDEFVVPPYQVRTGYILNLPTGEYSIHLETENGNVIEYSDKKLIVFEQNRTKGIGYEVIPGDKWTRPEESKTPHSVIYVDGSTDLYFRPFFENEYNDHYYKKLSDNNESGNPNIMTWVRNKQIPRATIKAYRGPIAENTPTEELTEEPYFVEQRAGSALGYNIIPYDPEGKHKDRDPSLIAYHLSLDNSNANKIHLKVLDEEGQPYKGSSREIRILNEDKPNITLIVLSIIPLVAMIVVLLRRRSAYQK
jgi:hypothetical protein